MFDSIMKLSNVRDKINEQDSSTPIRGFDNFFHANELNDDHESISSLSSILPLGLFSFVLSLLLVDS